MALYRLYLDESGSHVYSNSEAVDKRYLSITGVIISEKEIVEKLQPCIRDLKDIIRKDPDEVIILHREEIANRQGAIFGRLKDPALERAWNEQVMKIINEVNFRICTVVLDKRDHKKKYASPMHPYHYCIHLLVERYVKYLEKVGSATGDVMAEARGKTEDEALQSEYNNVYDSGTYYVSAARFQARLTSKYIKMEPKSKAIAGLELADLLVLASKLDILQDHKHIPRLNSKFVQTIVKALQPKYDCHNDGTKKGYGKKFLGEKILIPQK